MIVADTHCNALIVKEGADSQHHLVSATFYPRNSGMLISPQTEADPTIPDTMELTVARSYNTPLGESPPPPPRACFGRDELIDKFVGLAEDLTPIALTGAGGIGKTSIALTVLHHDRIKQRFGDNRRFIRCDQFPASPTHFLARLSKAVGAGVKNPEDLTLLRPFLSSTDMILFLDNAESILDPQGPGAREMCAMVEELSRFDNICLGLTSRISIIPLDCDPLEIPKLSVEAARDAFYRIHKDGKQSDPVDNILEQLDYHPLSVTLLATVAYHNRWDNDRLAREWEVHWMRVLGTDHNESLATTIELLLASPIFRKLGPDARDLLGVIAFFPQGVNENNLDWLFSTRNFFRRLSLTASDGKNMIDKFCTLSLTYRSNGIVMMLPPLRDYFCPKDPRSSPLLCTIKKRYFRWLSVSFDPNQSGLKEAQRITSEDANIEHLLDVFTTIDADSDEVWDTCARFMQHLYWHKTRLIVLGPKIERLPDHHPSKPGCLFQLSRLFDRVGNRVESKRLLLHTLELWRGRGDDIQVAVTLKFMCHLNQVFGLYKEAIQQAEEALEIYKQLNLTSGQASSLDQLAWSLHGDNQLDAAKEAALRAISLLPGKRKQFVVCRCYRVLGKIYYSKGETEKAIDHFETALRIASPFNWYHQLARNNYELADLFFKEGRFYEAHASVERAKSHAIDDPYYQACAMRLQAGFWYGQGEFEKAKSEALRAADVFVRLGAVKGLEECRILLRDIEEK